MTGNLFDDPLGGLVVIPKARLSGLLFEFPYLGRKLIEVKDTSPASLSEA